jgi:hypothetical protein
VGGSHYIYFHGHPWLLTPRLMSLYEPTRVTRPCTWPAGEEIKNHMAVM